MCTLVHPQNLFWVLLATYFTSSPSHLHVLTHLQTGFACVPHLHIFVFTSSRHLHASLRPHPHIFIFTSSHYLHASSHPHTSSHRICLYPPTSHLHLHIFTHLHIFIFTSSHPHTSSHRICLCPPSSHLHLHIFTQVYTPPLLGALRYVVQSVHIRVWMASPSR